MYRGREENGHTRSTQGNTAVIKGSQYQTVAQAPEPLVKLVLYSQETLPVVGGFCVGYGRVTYLPLQEELMIWPQHRET